MMGNISGIIYGSVLSATPSFLQAAISDTEAEYKSHLKEGVMNFIAEVLGTLIPEVFTYSAQGTVKAIIFFQNINLTEKSFSLIKMSLQS